jgi:hypothetical protein
MARGPRSCCKWHMTGPIRPVFVVGCPRSGTTVIGAYVGTSAEVCDLGEYGGFYLTLHHAPRELGRAPSSYRRSYQRSLEAHAAGFAAEAADQEGCSWYVDATPWNLLAVDDLLRVAPEALFVLCLRDYRGVVQSLQRSYREGYNFAGDTCERSAELWVSFNEKAVTLPPAQTIVVSYDRLCEAPAAEIGRLDHELVRCGLDAGDHRREVFATSHAVPDSANRPTVAWQDSHSGTVRLRPRPRYEPEEWTADVDQMVVPVVRDVDRALAQRFGTRYMSLEREPGPARGSGDGERARCEPF